MNKKGGRKMNKKGQEEAIFILTLLVVVLAFAACFAFNIVNYNEYAIEKEWGQIVGDFKEPGFTYVGIGTLIRVNNQMRNYPVEVDGFTSDKQKALLSITLNMKIKEEFVRDYILDYKDEATYQQYLEKKAMDKVKVVLSKYEGEWMLDNRETLSKELTDMLREVEEVKYFEFKDVVIDNIEFSDQYRAILEDKARVDIELEIIMKERANNVELKKNIDTLNIDSYLKYKIANNYKGESLFLGGEFMKTN
jgi:regulator of protease activity HflC (stomatin/prohibitin superfamily)